ncbi:MAG: DUF3617 family protein [Betaproteobacteria bacterium]
MKTKIVSAVSVISSPITCLSLCLAMFPRLAQAEQLSLKPGEYEIVSRMAVRGSAMPAEKKTRCFKEEQLSNVENVFNVRAMAGFCQVSGVTINAGKISYKANCPSSLVQVEGTIGADSYTVVRTQKAKDAKGADVTTEFKGKWIGMCK